MHILDVKLYFIHANNLTNLKDLELLQEISITFVYIQTVY